MAFRTGANRGAMAEINVTPLVDVMLVLLIIFMVTAPMMQEGVSVELPETKGSPLPTKPQKEEIVISVTNKGEILVNNNAVGRQDLVTTIRQMADNEMNRDVYLRADQGVPYGTVVRIIGALKTAGFSNLGMITRPEQVTAPTQ